VHRKVPRARARALRAAVGSSAGRFIIGKRKILFCNPKQQPKDPLPLPPPNELTFLLKKLVADARECKRRTCPRPTWRLVSKEFESHTRQADYTHRSLFLAFNTSPAKSEMRVREPFP